MINTLRLSLSDGVTSVKVLTWPVGPFTPLQVQGHQPWVDLLTDPVLCGVGGSFFRPSPGVCRGALKEDGRLKQFSLIQTPFPSLQHGGMAGPQLGKPDGAARCWWPAVRPQPDFSAGAPHSCL